MLQSAMAVLVDGLVHAGVAAQLLVGAAFLEDGLAGTGRVQLLGGLGVQPGNGAAQTQTLGSDDAHVAGGECLAHNAGVVLIHGLVGHGGQTGVTLVKHLVGSGAEGSVLLGIDHDGDLALVHNGLKLALDLGVQHFAQMLELEAGLKVGLGDTDTDHVALTGVHNALDAVDPGVHLTLHDGLEVGLHGLAGDFHGVAQGDLGADGDLVNLGAVHNDLVVFHLGSVPGLHQLEAVHTGAVHFHLHVAAADDLALESGGEGHGDVDVGDLQLDVASLQRGGVPLGSIQLLDQGLGNTEHVLGLVGDNGEAKADSAGAVGDDLIGQGLVSVDKRLDAVHGVLGQRGEVAGGHVTEDQRGTDGHGDNVDNGLHFVAQRHHADVLAQLHAGVEAVLDGVAGEGDQNTLCLIGLGQSHSLGGVFRAADDNGNAGDVAGDQRHAQITDEGVGQVAHFRLGIRLRAVQVLQRFQKLGAQSGCNAAFKGVVEAVVAGHLGLDGVHGGLHLTQSGDLHAGDAVVTGQAVSGAGERYRLAFAVSSDGLINGGYSTGVVVVVAAKNSFKKCHGISS